MQVKHNANNAASSTQKGQHAHGVHKGHGQHTKKADESADADQQSATTLPQADAGSDINSALTSVIQMLGTMIQSLSQSQQTQGQPASTDDNQDSVATEASPTSESKKSSASTINSSGPLLDWGKPADDTTDPNGAYQVPGGFEAPKGNEKADAAPGVTADPGTIQDADSAPDDNASHSQAAGTKQQHSIAQVDQMYGDMVQKSLDKYNAKYGTNVPKQVIEGIIYQETQGDPNTFGTDDPAQSRGLMQVTADNAARVAPGKNQYNPQVSIDTGVQSFLDVVSQYKGNYSQALAAYNQGVATTSQGKAYAQWVQMWANQAPR